jgi:hypothetical protein
MTACAFRGGFNMNNADNGNKVCSFCGENISIDFKRCPYCGSQLEANQVQSQDSSIDSSIDNSIDNSNFEYSKTQYNDLNSTSPKDSMGSANGIENISTRVEHEQYKGKHNTAESMIQPSMSNNMKVFLTTLCNIVPGLGQLAGVIIAIVLMNAEGDTDKKSFGLALLVTSLIVFVIMSISCCVLMMLVSESNAIGN